MLWSLVPNRSLLETVTRRVSPMDVHGLATHRHRIDVAIEQLNLLTDHVMYIIVYILHYYYRVINNVKYEICVENE